jgi:hypothetical protein
VSKISFGFKAHSGWAALIVVGGSKEKPEIIDRRRVELVEEEWAKAPYHAAEELEIKEARLLVRKGIQSAHAIAKRQMKKLLKRHQKLGHEVTACAVLMGTPMPDWSADEILAVHFRMHKAEGVLFREALAAAASYCELRFVPIPEKELSEFAERSLKTKANVLTKKLAELGKEIGPPWGKDQKDSTLAALIALHGDLK